MRILTVEDEVGLADPLRRGLTAEGHRVEDSRAEVDPGTVEVRVSSLRRKIDALLGRRSVLTVHGTGCRLSPDGG